VPAGQCEPLSGRCGGEGLPGETERGIEAQIGEGGDSVEKQKKGVNANRKTKAARKGLVHFPPVLAKKGKNINSLPSGVPCRSN